MAETALAEWLRRLSVMAGTEQATEAKRQDGADRRSRGDRGETTTVRTGTTTVPRSPAGLRRPTLGNVPLSDIGRAYGSMSLSDLGPAYGTTHPGGR